MKLTNYLSNPTPEERIKTLNALAAGNRDCKINAMMHWSLNVQYVNAAGKDTSHAMLCKDADPLVSCMTQFSMSETAPFSRDLKAMDLVSPTGHRVLSWQR